ncbi:MAG: hypothetical protein J6A01_08100, partial [Proteobacteria bacterium]|nr:hypothetical protein [Pseudomonadota bacterium]
MNNQWLGTFFKRNNICLYICCLLCAAAGCKRTDQDKQPPAEIGMAVTDNAPTQADTDTKDVKASDTADASACANGAQKVKDKCVCDDGSEWLGESWFCLNTRGQRCYGTKEGGCTINEHVHLFGTDYVNGAFIAPSSRDKTDHVDASNNDGEKADKYICKDNKWVVYDFSTISFVDEQKYDGWNERNYEANYYCGGVLVNSLGKEGEYTACEKHHPECKSNAYICRYDHWVCDDENGCKCFDGYETKTIGLHDFCENRRCTESLPENIKSSRYNSDAVWTSDIMFKDFEHGEDPGLCLEGNCPCGDGYCMKFGKCSDGVCSCHQIKTNQHGEFYCNHYNINYDYCSNNCGDEEGGILTCEKEGGCHTSDGRHYPKGSKIGFNGYTESSYSKVDRHKYWKDLAYRDALMFHIDAGFDTTVESTSPLGECVLDRTDSIPRGSNEPAASEFICDKPKCTCGSNTCTIGEICRAGECAADNCNAHDETVMVCDVDLTDGQQYFPHPGTPDVCIEPYVQVYDEAIIYFYTKVSEA